MSTIKPGIIKNSIDDTELKALEQTISSSNTLPYYTGSGTATTTPFTSAGRAIVGGSNITAIQTTLGVRPGIDVEIHKTNLTAIGNLTSATDTLPYFTGSGTASTTSLTTAARNLLSLTGSSDTIAYYSGVGAITTTPFTSAGRAIVGGSNNATIRNTLGCAINGTNNDITSFTNITITASGTADALTGTMTSSFTSLVDKFTFFTRALLANKTSTPSYTLTLGTTSTGTIPIVKNALSALSAGDIAGPGHVLILQYNLTSNVWVLLNPTTSGSSAGATLANYYLNGGF